MAKKEKENFLDFFGAGSLNLPRSVSFLPLHHFVYIYSFVL